jgi:hypothetical protein
MFGVVEIGGNVAFEARTTVTFEERGEATAVIVHQAYLNVSAVGADAISGARVGWTQQHDRLEAYLGGLDR